jgi:tetratricopeptide (TPR) repeat protein
LEQAEALLRRAIEMDPNYSDAWALLADTMFLQIIGGWRVNAEVIKEAKQAALMHAVRGEMELAIENFLNARRLNPNDPREWSTLLGLAVAHFFLEQNEQAVSWTEKALASNARALSILRWSIAIFASAGQMEKSKEVIKILLKQSPEEKISTTVQIHLRTLSAEAHKQKLLSNLRAAGFPE